VNSFILEVYDTGNESQAVSGKNFKMTRPLTTPTIVTTVKIVTTRTTVKVVTTNTKIPTDITGTGPIRRRFQEVGGG